MRAAQFMPAAISRVSAKLLIPDQISGSGASQSVVNDRSVAELACSVERTCFARIILDISIQRHSFVIAGSVNLVGDGIGDRIIPLDASIRIAENIGDVFAGVRGGLTKVYSGFNKKFFRIIPIWQNHGRA